MTAQGQPEPSPGALERELAESLRALAAAELHAAHLEVAVFTGRRIGVAVGILMCRRGLLEDQAVALLMRTSQEQNRKLRDIADGVVYTGDL